MVSDEAVTASSFYRVPLEMFVGGLSNGIASGILNPMDVCKTRMQTSSKGAALSLRQFGSMTKAIYVESGISGLWLGI